MPGWYGELQDLHGRMWRVLEGGPQAVLASLGEGGRPEQRVVMLRGADRAEGHVTAHTDALSVKHTEIAAAPQVSVLVWDSVLRLQIRLRGHAVLAPGTPSLWQTLPEATRGNYGVTPPPGTPIAEAGAYERVPDPARLAVVTCRVEEIDAVILAEDFHRRALFARRDGWRGGWLSP